jgi:peptide subunit release factor 1 (eRF1)
VFTDRDLEELLSFESEHPVLSLYLDTDPAEGNVDVHKLHFRSMIKDLELKDDIEAITRYFDHEYDWSGRSVAVISCAGDEFMRAYALKVPVRSRVRVGDKPYVKPLANLLDSYGGYGVVLVDKQEARLFYFHLGELREEKEIVGETIRHTKRGGGSQAAGRRGGTAGQTDYVEEVADRNIANSVEYANNFFRDNRVRRIMIGGTEDNIAMFRNQLPKALQSLVVGTFSMSMHAANNEVLDKALQIGQNAEHQREIQLAKTIVTNAAKDKGGVLGLDETMKAVLEGRVQVLLIRDGYRAPGFRCTGCGNLYGYEIKTCQFCGSVCEEIPDAVELVVREVMKTGGDVEVLNHDQVVGQFDQIGAILRY